MSTQVVNSPGRGSVCWGEGRRRRGSARQEGGVGNLNRLEPVCSLRKGEACGAVAQKGTRAAGNVPQEEPV